MSEWTGMHNPEQHKVEDGGDFTGCSGCFEECSADWPCRCCIAAEVGRLTAELASRDRRVEAALRVLDTSQTDIAAVVERRACVFDVGERGSAMMKRRPHWDDELEQTVITILFDCYNNGISEEQVWQVIAAVEDHLNPVWESSSDLIRMQNDALKARDAAIQRVRDALERYSVVPYSEMSQTDALAAVREALRGES